MACTKPGKRYRYVEEAIDKYMKRWFIKDVKMPATRRAREVQPATEAFVERGAQGGVVVPRGTTLKGGVAAAN